MTSSLSLTAVMAAMAVGACVVHSGVAMVHADMAGMAASAYTVSAARVHIGVHAVTVINLTQGEAGNNEAPSDYGTENIKLPQRIHDFWTPVNLLWKYPFWLSDKLKSEPKWPTNAKKMTKLGEQ